MYDGSDVGLLVGGTLGDTDIDVSTSRHDTSYEEDVTVIPYVVRLVAVATEST